MKRVLWVEDIESKIFFLQFVCSLFLLHITTYQFNDTNELCILSSRIIPSKRVADDTDSETGESDCGGNNSRVDMACLPPLKRSNAINPCSYDARGLSTKPYVLDSSSSDKENNLVDDVGNQRAKRKPTTQNSKASSHHDSSFCRHEFESDGTYAALFSVSNCQLTVR